MKDKKGAIKKKEETDRIRVYVRVRPRSEDEVRRGENIGIEILPEKNEVVLVDGRERRFAFDGIFTATATNQQVYSHVGRPLIDAAFSGFNGTLMAYGQTGTGKTFTLMSHDGVSRLMVNKLFRRLQKDRYHDYKVFMSYLQIYQEKIYDLLNSNHKLEMVLREDPKKGVYVENLTEYVVRSTDEVIRLMRTSKKRLVFAETKMNRLSSRSHSVCQITIQRSRCRNSPKQRSKSSSSSPPRQTKSTVLKAEGSKLPIMHHRSTRTSSTPDHLTSESKVPIIRKHSFQEKPVLTSTPTSRQSEGLKRPSTGKYSLAATSLPEMSGRKDDQVQNRLSLPVPRSGRGYLSSDNDDSDVMESESEWSLDSMRTMGLSDQLFEEEDIFQEEFEREEEEEEFLQSIKILDDVVIKGKLNICDLAGSERVKRAQVEGERLSELQHINLSLLELGNTIHALSEGSRTHIPFRNSSLTRLLQDSLGGNCKTSFVMCISPTNCDKMETRCTLEFGQRALKIKNTAHVNMEVDFMKLAADLRKRLEAQELEMKTQKENFEKQMLALKTDQRVELSEKDTLLEFEKEQAQLQVEQLKGENETLHRLLEEERSEKLLLEDTNNATLEKVLQEEKDNIAALGELRQELEKLKQELHDEKRRSLAIEQREKENLEQLIRDERLRAAQTQSLEKETFQKQLEEEKRKLIQGHQEITKNYMDAGCQSPQSMGSSFESQFPQIPITNGHTSTETLYNVLLAEIMSLQLLYQMQDLADSCGPVTIPSRDSGWTDCEDEALENVGFNLLEKGGLILNSLRNVQTVDSSCVASTESLREAFMLQFPLSPKASKDFVKSDNGQGTSPCRVRELKSSTTRGSNTTLSSKGSSGSAGVVNTGLESASSSSMGSYCDQEPLSPRARRQASDSGCSSQHSGSELSPIEPKSNLSKDFTRRTHGSNVCVPLAEEEDEEYLNDLDAVNNETFRLLAEKVSTLEKDLVHLKQELDGETMNFFSTVFLVEVSEQTLPETLQMRYLFDSVREKLLAELVGRGGKTNDRSNLELPLSVLEQAVNLLLVNKTVMSCILVLQNRSVTQASDEEGGRLMPNIPKVDQQTQTDEPVQSLRRKIKKGIFTCTSKHAGVLTEPEPRSPVHHRECQTSDECLPTSLPTESRDRVNALAPSRTEPWSDLLPAEVTSADSVFSTELLRNPDGASRTTTPVGSEDNASLAASTGAKSRDDHVDADSGEEILEKVSMKKKKRRRFKIGLLACLGPVGRKSSKHKTEQLPANDDNEKLMR